MQSMWMVDIQRTTSQIKTFHVKAETQEEALFTAKRNARTTNWDKNNNTEYQVLTSESLQGD